MKIFRKLRPLFRKDKLETEMAEEMRLHVELQTELNRKAGMSHTDARHAAQRQFGNVASLQEQAREERGWGWLERAGKDLRLGVHQLARTPGFALLAIITLGLGIGANTAMFSVLNSILLKPLPYPDSAQLDRFYRSTAQNPEGGFSVADFRDLQQGIGPYGEIAPYVPGEASLSEPGQPADMASAFRVGSNLLPLLGTPLQLGRNFRPAEDVHGNDRVLILSQRCWLNRFGGRADIIGRSVRVDGEPHQVVGVLPLAFNDWRHFGNVDFFRPLGLDPAESADRHATRLRILGRRTGRMGAAEANSFIASLGARLAADYPAENAATTWRLVPLNELIGGKNGSTVLSMLIGLSGLVLLIACSNLANFLLARTMTRAREFAVRSALGASRLQLLRPLIAESLVLALAGGVAAVIVALWFGDWLSVRSTGDNGERVLILLDWHVFGWAVGASLFTALAFGLAPALFALRLDLTGTLKSGGRGATGGRGHQRFRQILIIGQFALAMILLTGAALFIRGLHDLNNRRAGWESDHLVTGSVLLAPAKYPDPGKVAAFQRLVAERLQSLPGVASVSLARFTPFFNWTDARKYLVEGRALPERGHEPAASVNTVGPGYFETVGTHLLAGRTFTERDTGNAARVFLINQTMAKGLFGSHSPLGQRLALGAGADLRWGEVVGVVSDVASVVADVNPVVFQLYQPMTQEPLPRFELLVRSAEGVAPGTLIDSIRTAMAGLDADLPVSDLKTADAIIVRANYQLGVLRDMLTLLGLLGLGLAALGIYGVIARTMAQRTSEFAIRLALGASTRDITRLVLGAGVRQALYGAVLGLLGSIGVARLLAAGYPGMHLDSFAALCGTVSLLIGVALLACWLPARRAAKVDPMMALRAE